MSGVVIVHKHRNNQITVNTGMDLSGQTITSEIRSEPKQDAPLLATWTVDFKTDGTDGELILTMNEDVAGGINVEKGYMDLKRVDDTGEPWSVFDAPLEVSIRDTVTA